MVKRDRAFTAPLTPHGEPAAGVSSRNGAKKSAAAVLAPLLHGVFRDGVPVRFEFWDKSALGPSDGPGTVVIRSPYAIRRLLWAPGELGIARAYVTGEIGLDGDLFAVLRLLHEAAPTDRRTGGRFVVTALQSARELGVLGPPLPRPAEEASPRGWRHSKGRDARVVSHHYDISNAFYRMTLGPSMTYSCARFETGAASLEEAQTAKHDLICRKLGLHERRGAGSWTWAAVGDRWRCTPPRTTGWRWWESPSAPSRRSWPVSGSTTPECPTGSRSACRTTGMCAASISTPSRPSACSSTSARRRWRSISGIPPAPIIHPSSTLKPPQPKKGKYYRTAFFGGTYFFRRALIGQWVHIDGGDLG